MYVCVRDIEIHVCMCVYVTSRYMYHIEIHAVESRSVATRVTSHESRDMSRDMSHNARALSQTPASS